MVVPATSSGRPSHPCTVAGPCETLLVLIPTMYGRLPADEPASPAPVDPLSGRPESAPASLRAPPSCEGDVASGVSPPSSPAAPLLLDPPLLAPWLTDASSREGAAPSSDPSGDVD